MCTHPHLEYPLHAVHPAALSLMDCQRVQTAAHLSTLPTYSFCVMMLSAEKSTQPNKLVMYLQELAVSFVKGVELWAGTDEACVAPEGCCQPLFMNSKFP